MLGCDNEGTGSAPAAIALRAAAQRLTEDAVTVVRALHVLEDVDARNPPPAMRTWIARTRDTVATLLPTPP